MIQLLILFLSVSLSILYALTFNIIPDTYNFVFKSLSIILLAGFLTVRKPRIKGFALIVCALFASALGDIFLTFEHNTYFLYGLTSFFIAHIFYICAFSMRIQKPIKLSILQKAITGVCVLVGLLNIFILNAHVPDTLKWPVYAYICVITIMICTASVIRPFPSLVFIGTLSFGLSDSLLSTQVFIMPYLASSYLIWFFYYSAQVLIVSSDT